MYIYIQIIDAELLREMLAQPWRLLDTLLLISAATFQMFFLVSTTYLWPGMFISYNAYSTMTQSCVWRDSSIKQGADAREEVKNSCVRGLLCFICVMFLTYNAYIHNTYLYLESNQHTLADICSHFLDVLSCVHHLPLAWYFDYMQCIHP